MGRGGSDEREPVAPGGGGRLIVIEGPDLFGKSTQVGLLMRALEAAGETVVTMRFPTEAGSSTSAALAEYLAHGRAPSGHAGPPATHDPYEIAELFIRDREENAPRIADLVAAGTTVVLSRYWPSTLAFQGAHMPAEERERFWAWCRARESKLPAPDAVVVLTGDVDLVAGSADTRERPLHLEGTDKRLDVHEADRALQRTVAELYRDLADRHGFTVVEATPAGVRATPEAIAAEIALTLGSGLRAAA